MSQQSWRQQSTLCNQCNEKLCGARTGLASAPARGTGIRTPEDNLLYPEWRNQTQSPLGTTCATSGEGRTLEDSAEWKEINPFCLLLWSVTEATATVFLQFMRTCERLLRPRSDLINSFAVLSDIYSLICGGGGGKQDKETDGGAAFEYFPFSECRSEADAATLELWNSRPGTIRSAESLKKHSF